MDCVVYPARRDALTLEVYAYNRFSPDTLLGTCRVSCHKKQRARQKT